MLDECRQNYTLHLGVCDIPKKASYTRKPSVSVTEKWMMEFGEVTRGVCHHLCSHLYDMSCNSVLYNRHNRSCLLSSYAGTTKPIPCPNEDNPYEFYLKHRCSGELYVSKKITAVTQNSTLCDH